MENTIINSKPYQKTFKIELNLKEYILIRESLLEYWHEIDETIYPQDAEQIYKLYKKLKKEKYKE
tara:strand:- start:246 stop:440 length:195 start_codon:yes stop_codon:yes gene_type:complete